MENQPSPPAVRVPPVVLEEATGTDQGHVQQHLIDQVYRTLWIPEDLAEEKKVAQIQAAISLLQGIKPADEIESMLAIQMVATHSAELYPKVGDGMR